MKTKPLIFSFIALWLASAIITLYYGDIPLAGAFGDSFGAVNSLFSGVALALAVYSMILQQKQSSEFEQKTLTAMAQQAETIALIKVSLVQQANVAKVTALTYVIDREEQRIESLKQWGKQQYSDENYYSNGIKAAQSRIDGYQEQIHRVAKD